MKSRTSGSIVVFVVVLVMVSVVMSSAAYAWELLPDVRVGGKVDDILSYGGVNVKVLSYGEKELEEHEKKYYPGDRYLEMVFEIENLREVSAISVDQVSHGGGFFMATNDKKYQSIYTELKEGENNTSKIVSCRVFQLPDHYKGIEDAQGYLGYRLVFSELAKLNTDWVITEVTDDQMVAKDFAGWEYTYTGMRIEPNDSLDGKTAVGIRIIANPLTDIANQNVEVRLSNLKDNLGNEYQIRMQTNSSRVESQYAPREEYIFYFKLDDPAALQQREWSFDLQIGDFSAPSEEETKQPVDFIFRLP